MALCDLIIKQFNKMKLNEVKELYPIGKRVLICRDYPSLEEYEVVGYEEQKKETRLLLGSVHNSGNVAFIGHPSTYKVDQVLEKKDFPAFDAYKDVERLEKQKADLEDAIKNLSEQHQNEVKIDYGDLPMKLHEIQTKSEYTVMRIIDGWIYTPINGGSVHVFGGPIQTRITD